MALTPIEAGNRVAADLIEDLLKTAWSDKPLEYAGHSMRKPIDKKSYLRGQLVDLEKAKSRFELDDRQTRLVQHSRAAFRSRFARGALSCIARKLAPKPSWIFQVPAIGLYVLAGPDAGAR